MEVKELRIGNLIQADWHNKGFKIKEVELSDLAFMQKGIERDLFKPIPLTEEWLVKFGLNDTPIAMNCKFVWDGSCQLQTDDDRLIKHVKHVHQLQNLYFSLVGEELTLNNKKDA